MNKILCTIAALFCFFQISEASLETPQQFFVKQRWLSWTTTFDVETDQMKLGTVHRKFLSLSPVRYDFYDYAENLQAYATMRWFSWGATFDVMDANEMAIGQIDQKLFTFFPTFEILSPQGHVLAIAKMNFWGTTYYINDPVTKAEMATLSRSFFRLKDNWTVTLTNPEIYAQKAIDPRLFMLVMAFQTDREAWAAERNRRRHELQTLEGYSYSMWGGDDTPFQTKLKKCRAAIGEVTATEEELMVADNWVTVRLPADIQLESEQERLEQGFAYVQPMLEDLTTHEAGAVLQLFENAIQIAPLRQ